MKITSLQQQEGLKVLGKQQQLWIDMAFCLVLLPLMIYLLPIERWLESNTLFVALLVGWLYVVYLVNRLLLVPALFSSDKKKWMWALLGLLAMIAITYALSKYKMEYPFHHSPRHWRGGEPPKRPISAAKFRLHQQAVWFLFVIVITFSSAMGLLGELYRQRAKRQELEVEKNKAELSLYKAQIDPHFLFNTLNTLYSMVITGNDKTEDAFMQFIDITRYVYNNANQDVVAVDEEAHYLQQYIDLQRNRINELTTVNFNYTNDNALPAATIAPMLLITFVENALKYGVSTTSAATITIDLTMHEGTLKLLTLNPIHSTGNAGTGIGIENCRKRLDLIYGDRYKLDINNDNSNFKVALSINLSASSRSHD